ncbi:MAG: SET domain-containing protein-lysine N-methyltransferase [Flavobacteriales bacterium]|nr:SET domain-containing protein-lysine N-methyltransferase [Flavobacteriales bacterium]MBP9081188.1 SET domain-containing protein-lysine N-methyltransferase [Flavobacteriales bacterium]
MERYICGLSATSMASKIIKRNSKIHGQGVFATAAIKKGEDVVQYKGKLRTHAEVDDEYGGQDTGHTFLFILNDTYVIDANSGGNVARWINHGCAPNCKAFVIGDESGDPRKDKVVIEALRGIAAGEELTYDYDIHIEEPITAEERRLWACRCGAPNCTGTMLKNTKTGKRRAKAS